MVKSVWKYFLQRGFVIRIDHCALIGFTLFIDTHFLWTEYNYSNLAFLEQNVEVLLLKEYVACNF